MPELGATRSFLLSDNVGIPNLFRDYVVYLSPKPLSGLEHAEVDPANAIHGCPLHLLTRITEGLEDGEDDIRTIRSRRLVYIELRDGILAHL